MASIVQALDSISLDVTWYAMYAVQIVFQGENDPFSVEMMLKYSRVFEGRVKSEVQPHLQVASSRVPRARRLVALRGCCFLTTSHARLLEFHNPRLVR
jgi:hypothetical protein